VVSQYVPFDVAPQYVPHVYGIFFTTIATLYVMLGGMLSIVWTDVVQFGIMTVAGVVIAVIAMTNVTPEMLAAHVRLDGILLSLAGRWIWTGATCFL